MQAPNTLTLVPCDGSERDRIVINLASTVYVGRSSRCHVRLPKQARFVSRLHAVLGFRAGAWYLTDESRRGTFLCGRRLPHGQPALLSHGDRVRFGSSEFVVQLAALPVQTERIDPDKTYVWSLQAADLRAVDSLKILKCALELSERVGVATSEQAMYDAACRYLIEMLAPVIATACVTRVLHDEQVEILGRAYRREAGDASREVLTPIVSRRVRQRLQEAPEAVVFLHRRSLEDSLNATVNDETRVLGAALLDTDSRDRPILLYVVGDYALAGGEQLMAQSLRLVATLLRQHVLNLRRAHFAKYFSPRIAALLTQRDGAALAEGEPRVVTATSLFFDVHGSSPPLDSSAADLAARYDDLRLVISLVTETVFEFSGTIIDYAGDGVFAAWGVPFPQANQAALAVGCAIRIVSRLRDTRFKILNREGPLGGIGIAKGDVLAGALGSAIVFKYGIFGPSVNTAQRLVALTKPARFGRPVLMTAAVQAELAGSQIATRSLGGAALPGIGGEVAVFEPELEDERSSTERWPTGLTG